MDAGQRANEYLKKMGMHSDCIDFDLTVKRFADEMERGLRGEPSSLMMIPTYTTADGECATGKKVIVIDAGGTNLRVALCRFGDGGFELLSFEKFAMPGVEDEVSVEEFFDGIAGHVAPIADKSDTVGFCFSFAVKMMPNRDGRVIALAKEIRVRDSSGVMVCEQLAAALKRQGITEPKKYVLLNDTVSAMMGAKACSDVSKYDDYAGFILGTGTNICYAEPAGNILKDEDARGMGGKMIINIETGGFDKFARGIVDCEVDAASAAPGTWLGEKAISGRYLGELMFGVLKAAAEEGLLSAATAARVLTAEVPPLRDISEFYSDAGRTAALGTLFDNDQDAGFFRGVVEGIFARSAKLAAIELGAIFSHAGQGLDPSRPVCVCAEGTTLYKSPVLLERLNGYIRDELAGRLGVHVELVAVEDATIVGSALAALLNT